MHAVFYSNVYTKFFEGKENKILRDILILLEMISHTLDYFMVRQRLPLKNKTNLPNNRSKLAK